MRATNRGGKYPKTGGERRKRTVFSKVHVALLKKAFEENLYPGYDIREQLARQIGVEEDRVHVWFQNRRARTPKRIGSNTSIGNRATTPYNHIESSSPRSSLGSSTGSSPSHLMQQYGQPRNFHAESYRGGFWQPPLDSTQPGEQSYVPQQQRCLEMNINHQQAAVGGTGFCDTSQANNCPVPYYNAEMVRQPPPSGSNICTASSSNAPWCPVGNDHATDNYPASNSSRMLNDDGLGSGSQYFSLSFPD